MWSHWRTVRWRGAVLRVLALTMITIGLAPSQAIRALADDTGMPVWRLDGIDRVFGGGLLPSAALQRLFSQVGTEPTLVDMAAQVIYFGWLPVGWAVMAFVIVFRWDTYRSFAITWFGVWYLALIGFLLLPVEPPWLLDDVQRTVVEGIAGFVESDPNPLAAFPSLHVGMLAALAFQARASGIRTLSRPLFVLTALMSFAVVYLGEHYVVDVLAGVGVAWVAVQLSERFTRRRAAVLKKTPLEDDPALLEDDPARLAA